MGYCCGFLERVDVDGASFALSTLRVGNTCHVQGPLSYFQMLVYTAKGYMRMVLAALCSADRNVRARETPLYASFDLWSSFAAAAISASL